MNSFRILLPLALALLALSAMAGSALAAPNAKEIQVSLVDYSFNPKSITVNAGDTVVWTNNGQVAHTVTASDGSWDSGRLEPGKTFSHTFDTAGTVPYYCKPHGSPDGNGMAGTVVVMASTGAQPAPQTPAQPAPTAAPSQPAAQQPSGMNMLDASDQALSGNSITIASVMAAADGWLVVHANTADNKPGNVLGETAVKAGDNQNVRVTLNPAPKAGDKVWPMLHIDAPQKGVYEFPGADAPVNENGSIVMKQITVLASTSGAQQPGAVPGALPNTGDNDPSTTWIVLLAAGVTALLGSALFLTRADRHN